MKAERTVWNYEHIEHMSEEFAELRDGGTSLTTEEVAVWDLRIKLAIAQQLSIIAAALKARGVE